MLLTGKHIINASAQTIWNMMMDPDTLARITPGISKLEKIDADNYKAIANIKIGPVGGAFSGTLKVSDREEPKQFKLTVQQHSKIGNAHAVIDMDLNPLEETQTEVAFKGTVKLTGTLAIMGGRVLVPVANLLSKQFFEALEAEVVKIC
jgi:uncharacterized protein